MTAVVREVRLSDGAGGSVSGRIHEAAPGAGKRPEPTLALTHGAGGDLETPGLVALGAQLASRGIRVLRFNLPAAEAGRRRPDRPAAALRTITAAAGWAREAFDGPLFLGGRSFGGRMASLLLADPAAPICRQVAGAVFLAYPLKPPGKPEIPAQRVAHLSRIGLPMLFVSGDRDPFAPPLLLERAAVEAGAEAEVCRIAGGDHGFRVAKPLLAASGRSPEEVEGEIAGAVLSFVTRTTEA